MKLQIWRTIIFELDKKLWDNWQMNQNYNREQKEKQ